MHEFSEKPFVAGSLTGLRSFKVTSDGVLTGCFRTERWAPGVNEAKCLSFGGFSRATMWAQSEPEPHHIGQLHCTCGFYAYFDLGDNPHHTPANVLGLIEGFGTVTVGTRGFRASKARIQALISGDIDREKFALITGQYPEVPVFPTLEAALAEFPLTPVAFPVDLRKRPTPVTISSVFASIGLSAQAAAQAFADAIRDLSRQMKQGTGELAKLNDALKDRAAESPKDRALRLRRERNTGPADRHRLDGSPKRGK